MTIIKSPRAMKQLNVEELNKLNTELRENVVTLWERNQTFQANYSAVVQRELVLMRRMNTAHMEATMLVRSLKEVIDGTHTISPEELLELVNSIKNHVKP